MITALDSLRNCEAVQDAGGLDGWVRECMAETKTAAIARTLRDGVHDEGRIAEIVKETLKAVIARRLSPLLVGEYLAGRPLDDIVFAAERLFD